MKNSLPGTHVAAGMEWLAALRCGQPARPRSAAASKPAAAGEEWLQRCAALD